MRLPKKIILKILLLGVAVFAKAAAFAPTNFFPPYAPTLRLPPVSECDPFRLGVNVEWGKTHKGRNWDGKKRNVLQINDDTQSTIAMFEFATPDVLTPEFIAIRDALRIIGARDDGQRGHITLTGEFEQIDVTPHVRYVLPVNWCSGELALFLGLPIRHARIDGVHFTDLTNPLACPDQRVQELLTGSFDLLKLKTKALGNLSLDDWKETGLGDLLFTVGWSNDYPQDKDGLHNVELHAFIGVLFPTSEPKDEDRAFSIAFGNDGAWAMPFGLGIDLDFAHHIALGAEAQFEVIFDHTKTRRMKTHLSQTEFLLLNKGRASKDHGLTWKFYLYLQAYRFWRGLSFKTSYEYVKHDSDRLTPKSDDFNSAIVNSAHSLGEWNMHHFIFDINYDFLCTRFKPQLHFFYKLPITGKKVINPHTIGGQLAVNF